jgi:hypothetical protein
MGGLLVTLIVVTVAVTLATAALLAVTVLPLYVALAMADARRFSTARWVAVSAVLITLGLGYAYLLHSHTKVPAVVAVLPLLLTWGGPGALWLLDEGQTRIGGRAGRHE